MKDVVAHTQDEKAQEHIVYPEHTQRVESEEFTHNKHILVHSSNLPCFKCAIKHSDGTLPPEAYQGREVHHFVVEWAAWNAVDPAKVQKLFDSGVFDFYGFSGRDRGKPVNSPDDIRNLVVLCEKHHRDSAVGIHHTTAPEWFSDMVAKEGIDILLTKEEWTAIASGQKVLDKEGRVVDAESK